MYRLNLSLMGASASEWADQQIGEMIIEAIGEVVGSDQSADNKEKMITALIRRQNAFFDKAGTDRIWDSPEHFFNENEVVGKKLIRLGKNSN